MSIWNEYPNSNAHELNLDWIINKVKELSAEWAQTRTDWTNVQAAWEEMKAYVNNYFENLDVQNEINVKLDDMAESGELSPLIAPFVESGLPGVVQLQLPGVVALQIGDTVAAQLPYVVQVQLPDVVATYAAGQVAAWLAEHVNPETGYVIDDTLTIQGAAADAKAVGDAIGELRSALSDITGNIKIDYTYGKYIRTDGNIVDISTIYDSASGIGYAIISTNFGEKFTINGHGSNYARTWCFIDSTGNVLSKADASTFEENLVITAPENATYLITHQKNDDKPSYIGEIVTEEIKDIYEDINNLKNQTNDGVREIPNIIAINGSISINGGKITNSSIRLLSCLFKTNTQIPIVAGNGYLFRIAMFDNALNFIGFYGADFVSSYTIKNVNYYYMLNIRKSNAMATINPDELFDAITSTFSNCTFYSVLNNLVISNANQIKDYTILNPTALSDMVWEYQNWVFPQIISYNKYRNRLYFGWTSQAGYTGIAQYDYDNKEVTRYTLKKNSVVDDHNLVALIIRPDGKILTAYSRGHASSNEMAIRISDASESINSFGDEIVLTCSDVTTYAQLFIYNSKVYMFYRLGITKWAYRISNDYGLTWSDEVVLITAPMQYYIQLTETTTNGVLRMCCYSNPEYSDTAIRMGYLHLSDMTLYDTDNVTVIGTSNIDKDDVTVIIPIPNNGKVNRLYNSAKTEIGNTLVLYCEFTNSGSSTDGVYKLYDNGVIVNIANAGRGLWIPKTQLGVAWIGNDKIAVARGEVSDDVIEIYSYDSTTHEVTFETEVVRKTRGSLGIRTARPMIDQNQKTLIYFQGFFDSIGYTNFVTDGKIFQLT